MSSLNSKVQICNLASGSLGIRNSINNIDTPTTDKEIVYSLWYDIVRQMMLQMLMPNFALGRAILSPTTVPTAYAASYAYAYLKPVNCLKALGLGDIDTDAAPPTVEGPYIFTNNDYGNAPVLRFVDDVLGSNVSNMTPDFIFAFAFVLGKCTALSQTQDQSKKASILKDAMAALANATAQNAQENKPIRRSQSKFREARRTRLINFSTSGEKR